MPIISRRRGFGGLEAQLSPSLRRGFMHDDLMATVARDASGHETRRTGTDDHYPLPLRRPRDVVWHGLFAARGRVGQAQRLLSW
jgi:hypothetical protein